MIIKSQKVLLMLNYFFCFRITMKGVATLAGGEAGTYMHKAGPFFFTCTEIGSKFAPVLSQHQRYYHNPKIFDL
jgi:hypothetical protein